MKIAKYRLAFKNRAKSKNAMKTVATANSAEQHDSVHVIPLMDGSLIV